MTITAGPAPVSMPLVAPVTRAVRKPRAKIGATSLTKACSAGVNADPEPSRNNATNPQVVPSTRRAARNSSVKP